MDEYGIRDIQGGDDRAFARLYDRLADKALRYAAAMTGSDALSADAVQEMFLRIYRHIGQFDASRPFEPWFYRILANECRRAVRWRKRLVPVESLPEQAGEDARPALYEAIGRLGQKLREPLVLRYLMGYGEQETAELLGVSLTTAKGRIQRAKRRLMEILTEGDAW